MKKPYYITTAIAYTSRKPHVGNTYEIVLTDAIARYHRLKGEEVYFLTGTDEHGQKIEEEAKSKGITPKEYVDNVAGQVREIGDLMDTSYNQFIRTTDEQHKKIVQKIFKKLYDKGDIYKSTYEGLYCTPCESFFTETQLVDGKCPDCGREVKKASEEAYFFKMSKYQDRLMKHIEENPDFITPESRKKEMVNNFLKPGLQDLCVSRTSFSWGVPVDFDEKHVVYVWIDALSNYITALGYDPDGSSELFNKFWPADVHIIGKDILRFHTIYWPAILMALDLPLPKQIFGHPWMLFNKEKMSKSKGNVIYADDLARQFSVDAVRYYLISEMPYGSDGNITYETVVARYNSDLANTIGNLVKRTVTMCKKYFDGKIECPAFDDELSKDLQNCALESARAYISQMDSLHLADGIESMMNLARRANKYIDETMPWALGKDETKKEQLMRVLFDLLESIRFIGVMLTPIIPQTAKKIFEQLNTGVDTLESLASFGGIGNVEVGEPETLFDRVDEIEKLKELSEFAKKQVEAAQAEQKAEGVVSMIEIEDFKKVTLKVAKIKECEKVEKSDKLYKLQLEDGENVRQVVSGIAAWYKPEDLIGKSVIIVANLKPAKLRGVESNGMLLAADNEDGSANVIFVDGSIAPGSILR